MIPIRTNNKWYFKFLLSFPIVDESQVSISLTAEAELKMGILRDSIYGQARCQLQVFFFSFLFCRIYHAICQRHHLSEYLSFLFQLFDSTRLFIVLFNFHQPKKRSKKKSKNIVSLSLFYLFIY